MRKEHKPFLKDCTISLLSCIKTPAWKGEATWQKTKENGPRKRNRSFCDFDPFKDGKSIYTFEATCRENKDIVLADKRKTIFANLRGDREGIEQEVVNLLDYFRTGEPTDEFTRGLQGKVEQLRNDDEWRENRMTIEMREKLIYRQGKKEGIAEGIEQGIEQGREQGREQGIRSLVEICQMYEISYEKTKMSLRDKFQLSEEKTEEFMDKFWR